MEQDRLGVDNGRGNRALYRRRPAFRRGHDELSEEIFLVSVHFMEQMKTKPLLTCTPLFVFCFIQVPLITSLCRISYKATLDGREKSQWVCLKSGSLHKEN